MATARPGERRPANPRRAGAGRRPSRSGRGAALTRRDAGGGAGGPRRLAGSGAGQRARAAASAGGRARVAASAGEQAWAAAALENPGRINGGGLTAGWSGGRYLPPAHLAVSSSYRRFNWR